ncbi:MAG: efflux RND transporter periplasmic adaptor subunit [Verrucomicrobia bacterium]|jgi:HlyD family secretion protein|nr:efflux RND transporter periplasmic adaptor subunit [Verrucomicrobiota bacterium]MCU0785345.1 efflux RND transporter periplasmic adaptor subunit [Verrucomicrobiota bacterium]
MKTDSIRNSLRKSAKWLLLAAIVVVVVYRAKFAPVPVEAFEVKPGVVVGEVMGTGTLEARVKTTISPRIQERLAEVLVDQGDTVHAGQLLARLDDGELKRQVEVAEASLAAAKATAERVRVDEARARAVEQQAQQDHKRVSELLATKVSSTAEMDKAVEQLRVAEADLQRARAATVEAGQQVITAERNLDYQRERLAFSELRSPYDGLITKRERDPGGVVVPGSSMLQLISTNELWVSAWVDETASARLALGQKARVVFRSEAERNYIGEVARLGRETDPETREFLVDVRVRELPPNWTIGQRAEVFIETGRKSDALAVPQTCLQWRDGQPAVLVAEHGKASWREVTLGLRGRDSVEVVQGLVAGERVLLPRSPQQPPLKPGQRIKAK